MENDDLVVNGPDMSTIEDILDVLIQLKLDAEDMHLPIFNRRDAISRFIIEIQE